MFPTRNLRETTGYHLCVSLAMAMTRHGKPAFGQKTFLNKEKQAVSQIS